MRPNSNGLVELHDTKQIDSGFFCMKLVDFLNEEAEMGTDAYAELWEQRFDQARAGGCAYRERCPIYEKTIKKHPVQLSLF